MGLLSKSNIAKIEQPRIILPSHLFECTIADLEILMNETWPK